QAGYAIGLLAEVPGYDLTAPVETLARHTSADCRARAYEVAATARYAGLVQRASHALEAPAVGREQQAALAYLLAVSPEAPVTAAWVQQAAADAGAWRR